MKILYHHRVASKDGQFVHIEEIIKSLKKHGHEILLVAPSMGENQDFGGDGGIVAKLKAKLPQWLYEVVEFSYSFYTFLKLAKTIVKDKPVFIYERYNLFNPAGIWAKKIFKLPLILEVNAPLFEERSKYDGISLKGFAKWTENYTWRNADMVLPVTNVLAEHIRSAGVKEDNIEVIANGINTDAFLGEPLPSPLLINTDNKVVIGFVGFCREWHGLDKIVRLLTMSENQNLFFLIVGDGPVIPSIKDLAKELGVEKRVHITGLVERDDMPAWLEPMDIALQPAVVPYASPLKMIEYLAKGKAIVAPSQPNIKELLIDEENALLFEAEENEQFISCIQRLAADDELRSRLSANAKATIEHLNLTWDENAERIVNLAIKKV
ncbi:glycosyltransferase family 4 protein [Thalassotalea sp. M1531]|uniref:Glycosyltransferase family 4 protein n=1 Tax=Thalassotalea algicola TaxID=2716224 RepID=A0A7Y0Q8M6_9GAMM|nr:glycosyltransferase family 4 protein [Thalassotalea algicola]NMP33062.1 glycosyltransferase family 4 protein [Thalassotalea algicola]